MSQSDAQALRCADGCGASVIDQADALQKAWRFLEISKRWRCPACVRALAAVTTQQNE